MRFSRRLLTSLFITILLSSFIAGAASADVTLHGLFTDHAVLQRDRDIHVWGRADEGEEVTVDLAGHTATAKADGEGRWLARLPAMSAGGPYDLNVAGKNSIQLGDIMIGDVWICSGQSNMQWPMSASFEAETNVAAAQDDGLRLFTVPRRGTEETQDDVEGNWSPCAPDVAKDFSAVGYFFGRDLRRRFDVPIGLISTNYGGTPAEAWTSREKLSQVPELQPIMEYPLRPQALPHYPGGLYNAMIHPLLNYPIKGAIWYQGESNAGRAWQYRTLFPTMIQCWREDWKQGDFPFLLVQLAPFDPQKKHLQGPGDSNWAELREAQLLSTKVLPNVGMAVITDVGEMEDIHPRHKEEVGGRLAIEARNLAYGEDLEFSGPQVDQVVVGDGAIRIRFAHADSGLAAKVDGDLKPDAEKIAGFTICGEDRTFHPAVVKLVSDRELEVSCPDVPNPVAVRFGWADYPEVNLWNGAGLPASPFRTDDFPAITKDNK